MKYQTRFQSIVLMGKIASGKGTQAQAIMNHFGGTLYSNGNKVRETATQETKFGKKMKETYEAGLLIPEWIASYWMTHALVSQYLDERVVFEAVAKKPDEAIQFHDIHQWLGRPYVVFNLVVSDDVVRQRSSERARDVVDSEASVERRLEEFRTHTDVSIKHFSDFGTLIEIDGERSPKEVQKDIFSHLLDA